MTKSTKMPSPAIRAADLTDLLDEQRLRTDIGAALVRSGYLDQGAEDPDAFDLVQWHHCWQEPACPVNERPAARCACSGVPYVSDEVWKALGPVVTDIIATVRAEYDAAVAFETSCLSCARRLTDEAAIRADEAGRVREQVAEEIARAIEVAKGFRCPECGEPPETWKPQAHCTAGHHWQWSSKTRVDAAEVARQHARTEEGR